MTYRRVLLGAGLGLLFASTMDVGCGTSDDAADRGDASATEAGTTFDSGFPSDGGAPDVGDGGGPAQDASDRDSGPSWANAKVTGISGEGTCGAAKDGDTLYWVEQDEPTSYGFVVRHMPFAGGTIATIATPAITLFNCGAIAVDAQKVYILGRTSANTAIVVAVPKSGGPSMNVATPAANDQGIDPMNIAVDAKNVFYGISNQGVYRVPTGGGTIDALASGEILSQLAIDDTMVYFSAETGSALGTIYGMPKSSAPGGPENTLVKKNPTGLALDETSFFFASGAGGINVGQATVIYTAPKTGGAPAIVTSTGGPYVSKVAVHGDDLFYTASDSNQSNLVVHVPKAGGPLTVVTTQPFGMAGGLLTDGVTLYVFDPYSGLFKITR